MRGNPTERRQGFALRRPELPGHAVDHTQRPGRRAVRGGQRRAGVEADARVFQDQGIVLEAQIGRRIGNFKERALMDGVGAERLVAGGLGHAESNAGLEPLAIFIDQTQKRNRDLTDDRGDPRQIIEQRLGFGIEYPIALQVLQPLGFADREQRAFTPQVLSELAGDLLGGQASRDAPWAPASTALWRISDWDSAVESRITDTADTRES